MTAPTMSDQERALEAARWLKDFLGPIPEKHFSAVEKRALTVARALLAPQAARDDPKLAGALIAIRDHWACQYDHPRKANEMYAGPYGIGVTDGHRAAAIIARNALERAAAERAAPLPCGGQMTDIVEWLRKMAAYHRSCIGGEIKDALFTKAAAEIERLRAGEAALREALRIIAAGLVPGCQKLQPSDEADEVIKAIEDFAHAALTSEGDAVRVEIESDQDAALRGALVRLVAEVSSMPELPYGREQQMRDALGVAEAALLAAAEWARAGGVVISTKELADLRSAKAALPVEQRRYAKARRRVHELERAAAERAALAEDK